MLHLIDSTAPTRKCLAEERALTVVEGVEVSSGVLLVHGLAGNLLCHHVSDDSEHGKTVCCEN